MQTTIHINEFTYANASSLHWQPHICKRIAAHFARIYESTTVTYAKYAGDNSPNFVIFM